eukprot:CAMPEP_0113470054 /NCGR_PEP_ID=MMETSP0014_2-20120614/16237_1 /TAXON_ID=2857 /ORGANISM="Nitzschia sp." /LENGTH=295 /DNA_ID=CAMNT_0000362591 /DNA_START=195 /DNA_END=1082 /DNA_ORIENTATION=+ /assembly_acc=CAM_ASM_000159
MKTALITSLFFGGGVRQKEEEGDEEEDGSHNNVVDDDLDFVRPGVITGRRYLQRLARYYIENGLKVPVVYCCSKDEVDDAIAQVSSSSLQTASTSSAANSRTDVPVFVLIIRVNYGTSVRYERSRPSSSSSSRSGGGGQSDDPKNKVNNNKNNKKKTRGCSGHTNDGDDHDDDHDDAGGHDSESDGVRGAIDIAEYVHFGCPEGGEEEKKKMESPAIRHGVAVILQTETKCLQTLTTWFEMGVVPACRRRKVQGKKSPLYSMHLLQLSRYECYSQEELESISQPYRAMIEDDDDW